MDSANHSQFKELSNIYTSMAEWPFRREIEIPSVLELLGDIKGKRVLDYGCGEGTYSRLLKSLGAESVTGFDLEKGMLVQAENIERVSPCGIEYVSELDVSLNGTFDVVLAVYVLPYANNKDLLMAMCKNMAKLLKPGGKLVALPVHPDYEKKPGFYEKYGFSMLQSAVYQEGGEIQLDLFCSGTKSKVKAWYWSFLALEEALVGAGFTHINFTNPLPEKYKDIDRAPEFLQDYLMVPHAVIIDCIKFD
ncbi:class I SAM-dependent methyltransferase [Pseudomonas sp. MPFS]|uniref:class I SAM-dependent methyltransferase n=1 Tax=Pseudomonas sp. MPFS TaxID=2795724 RepID=UPI001F130896|nr:class I SAM-dependent methyltransferase [Pseudomonas sp. MPFS]UMZ10723.1 class I SAM-dependent methyltransferase [Pseudomonas sp. MPFS]